MSVDEIMEKKRREHRRYVMTIRFTTGLAIAVALIVAMVSVYNDMSLRARHQHEMDQLAEYYVSTGSIFQDARFMEYDIMMRRADITSNQNMVEQNVNICYNLIDTMSAKTDDDAMIKVIEERISHVKDTMSTADLLQAIEILKENFPDESYEELDRISQMNNDLMNNMVKQKEAYNLAVTNYQKFYTENKQQLDAIGYIPFTFELYEVDGEG